jgi:hypothetical protein
MQGFPADAAFQRALRRAMADLVDGRTQRRLPGVEPSLLYGPLRERGFGLLPVTEHDHACHAKWLCLTLSTLLQAVTTDVARDPAEIILLDATDLPGGVGPPRQRPDPIWLPLAANALKMCNPSMPPLQTLLCAAYSTPTDRALGWLTDVCVDAHQQQLVELQQPPMTKDNG